MGLTTSKKDNDYLFDDLSDEVVELADVEDPTWIDKLTGAIPTGFKDWLYEAERSDLGGVDIGTYDDDLSVMDVVDPSEGGWDRASDLGRGLIQSGAYMGDFWKDLGMLPYNLLANKEDPFARIFENPEWAEDIGYESDWGQKVMEDPRARWMQENLLPYVGPGLVAKTGLSGILGISKQINKIPGLRELLGAIYPTTMKGFKKGLKPALRPGNIPFNVGLPYLWNQLGKKFGKTKEQNVFDDPIGTVIDPIREQFNMSKAPDFSPISSAYAADVSPGGGGYAAGQMPTPRPRKVIPRHPREMMEMANRRGSPQEGWGMSVEFPNTGQISDRYALD